MAASCGDGGGGKTVASTTAVSTTTAGAPSTSTAPDASKLLLTAAEIGDGWTALGATPPELAGLVLCDAAPAKDMATLRSLGPYGVQNVFRSREGSAGEGPLKLVEAIYRGDRAPEWFAAVKRVLDACRGQSWTEQGLPTHLAPMTVPDLGDRAVAYLITSTEPATATSPELTWRGPIVAALVSDMLMTLHPIDVQKTGSKPRLSDSELNGIAARAVDKVEAHG